MGLSSSRHQEAPNREEVVEDIAEDMIAEELQDGNNHRIQRHLLGNDDDNNSNDNGKDYYPKYVKILHKHAVKLLTLDI